RYAATKDAIDASSSTTSTVCGFVATASALSARSRDLQPGRRCGRQRLEVGAVDRIEPVLDRRVGHPLEGDLALPDREQVHAGAVDRDLVVVVADGAESEVGPEPAHLRPRRLLLAQVGAPDRGRVDDGG